ncbi:FAD assembly factor SdhE [Pseudooceanicola sp. 502str34]
MIPVPQPPADETREHRLKRLYMRSIRRGIKEMDIVCTRFADAELQTMSEADLALYDQLLGENDQDLLLWVTGKEPAPAPYTLMIDRMVAVMGKA